MNLDSDSEEEDEVLGGGVTTVPEAENVVASEPTDEVSELEPAQKSARMITAEAGIERNEWDISSWEAVFAEALALPNIHHARKYFEQFVQKFPTAGRYWKFYAEHEAKFGHIQEAQAVIQRGLAESLSTELFRYYIDFVQEQAKATLAALPTNANEETTREAQERAWSDVEKAYEQHWTNYRSHSMCVLSGHNTLSF